MKIIAYSATTLTKATQENFTQTSQWESYIGTMDFHKITVQQRQPGPP